MGDFLDAVLKEDYRECEKSFSGDIPELMIWDERRNLIEGQYDIIADATNACLNITGHEAKERIGIISHLIIQNKNFV